MNTHKKCIVLLSGGLDSSVNLFEAHTALKVELVLTFDYGQRAARREIRTAEYLCNKLGLKHKAITVPFFKDFTQTSLVNEKAELPTGKLVNINDFKNCVETAKKVWVPNRNGIFINIAAGFAENMGVDYVVVGFNVEEAQTFPDNTQEFLDAVEKSLSYSTGNHVKMKCFTTRKNKTEIVRRAWELGINLEELWPCYVSTEKWCGQCESCMRFDRAIKDAKAFKVFRDLEI
ncbi:MAG: hypothetical protein A4S09_05355 [Proteobacteria bacterium SG_bin7]|nr:MAG: hypothetical protein A4S09_05355 [Proteobacteria bacterium SG_bin7]